MADTMSVFEHGYVPWTRDEIETLARRLIDQSIEGSKIDFKERFSLATKAEQVEFAKDISAIANSDHDACRDHGFVVLGARRGQLVGGVEVARAEACDKTNAQMTEVLKEYLAPMPVVYLIGYLDPLVGPWGVVVVPPSQAQPHLFHREYSGSPARGDWFVRLGDITHRARPEDYLRVLNKTVVRAVRPLEDRLQELALRTRMIEERQPSLLSTPETLQRPDAPIVPTSSPGQPSPVEQVRALLRSRADEVRDLLERDALTLRRVLDDDHSDLPWTFRPQSRDDVLRALAHLECAVRPLIEMLALIVRGDAAGHHADAVARAFALLAREPRPPQNTCTVGGRLVRLYPLALALHLLVAFAIHEQRGVHLAHVLRLIYDRGVNQDDPVPFAAFLRDLWGAADLFNLALGGNKCEPTGQQIHETMVQRLGDLAVPDPEVVALQAGFTVALVFESALQRANGQFERPIALPGMYMYDYGAKRAIHRLLRAPSVLDELFGTELLSLLKVFDETAPKMVNRFCMGSGFTTGAAALYEARSSEAKA